LNDIEEALLRAPDNSVVVITFHHHILPLPEESMLEKISSFFNYPFAKEIKLGKELIEIAKGKTHLILAGHRHQSYSFYIPCGNNKNEMLSLYNAGCTSRMRQYRMWKYKNGIITPPEWITY
jgi:Icc protein